MTRRDPEIFDPVRHEEKLDRLLWRTLDRLEQALSDRTIDAARAREVMNLVSELARAAPVCSQNSCTTE